MAQQPIRPIRTTRQGVSQDILLSCVDPAGRSLHVATTLGYRTDDPYAVSLLFRSAGGGVEWVVSRTLLLQGLATPCGDGDIRVCPGIGSDGRPVAVLHFCSPDGRLVAEADLQGLQSFLARTFELVPVGAEGAYLDMDRLIAGLLGAA